MFISDRLNITTERKYTDEGFLKVPARISRVGVQNYTAVQMGVTDKEPDAIIRVYRPQEEVFSKESLESFTNKPVTDDHPPELVTPSNAKKYSVGHAGPEITKDGIFAKTTLHITDANAISKIEGGKVELSNGYIADIEWTAGISPDGEQYDAVQRKIRGNHIAIVERGRAGPDCRVADNLPTEGDFSKMKITIDGVDFEVSEQAGQAVGKLQVRLKDAEEKTLSAEEKAKAKEDEMEEAKKKEAETKDSMQAKIDDANSKIPTADTLDALVTDRTTLLDAVRKVMPDIDWKGKDADTLRKEVVAAKCSSVQMDSVSADYINARFDMLVEDIETNSQHTLDDAFSKQVKIKDGEKDTRPASVIARDNMAKASRDAWKGDKT